MPSLPWQGNPLRIQRLQVSKSFSFTLFLTLFFETVDTCKCMIGESRWFDDKRIIRLDCFSIEAALQPLLLTWNMHFLVKHEHRFVTLKMMENEIGLLFVTQKKCRNWLCFPTVKQSHCYPWLDIAICLPGLLTQGNFLIISPSFWLSFPSRMSCKNTMSNRDSHVFLLKVSHVLPLDLPLESENRDKCLCQACFCRQNLCSQERTLCKKHPWWEILFVIISFFFTTSSWPLLCTFLWTKRFRFSLLQVSLAKSSSWGVRLLCSSFIAFWGEIVSSSTATFVTHRGSLKSFGLFQLNACFLSCGFVLKKKVRTPRRDCSSELDMSFAFLFSVGNYLSSRGMKLWVVYTREEGKIDDSLILLLCVGRTRKKASIITRSVSNIT